MNEIEQKITALCPPDKYLLGFADLTGIPENPFSPLDYGLSLARKLDDKVIDSISEFPGEKYLALYNKVNAELNSRVMEISGLLYGYGIDSIPVKATLEDSELDEHYRKTLRYSFSHKMIATRAGLGWIGKTDLLVTKMFGPRVRLGSVVMNARIMDFGTPINKSMCGKCTVCVDACPAQAANGIGWEAGVDRNVFYDPFKCREYCRKISMEKLNKKISLCGKCISLCPLGASKKPGNGMLSV